jgi:hypothetical protein
MKTRLDSMIVAGTVLTALVGAHLQGSIVADPGSRVLDERRLTHTPVARATDLAPGGRSRLVYVIAGRTLQFGALDLSSGTFLPIGPGVPPDVGGGLVQGLGTSLLTLAFSGNLDAIDPSSGLTSVIGASGLRDCSVPGSYDPNCANVMGRLGGKFYATDFANNLYSVNSETGAATLIGPTGMPEVTFAPFSENPDGTFNVFSESFVTAHGRLYANFATLTTDFVTVDPVIQGALYQVDPSTGQATWIGPTDPNITAMVNLNDTVYAFDVYTNQVLALDLTTGQTTPVSDVDPAVMSLIVGAAPARKSPAAGRGKGR